MVTDASDKTQSRRDDPMVKPDNNKY
jgi:hypothetical protein